LPVPLLSYVEASSSPTKLVGQLAGHVRAMAVVGIGEVDGTVDFAAVLLSST
jgi:hypothetical protein